MRKWLLFSFLCCSLPAFAQKDSSLALTHVTVIDCTGAPAQPNSTVVVAQGQITAVGLTDAIKIPAGTRVVDATGKFLIPGLWDMHGHLTDATEDAFPLLIMNGVTGVRDMGERAEAERVKATPGGLQIMGCRPMPSPLDVEALAKADEQSDDEPPNGSSIAFVAEWKGKRILFAADAHSDLLIKGLRQLIGKEPDRYRLDLFKVSHHGSVRNTSRALIELLQCRAFLLSTNGSRHGHPDPETIARFLKYGQSGPKALYFNYRQPYTAPWNQQALKDAYDYTCCFPSGAAGHLVIDL
jgi:hypothetical protein